jgi:hypothetical protein
MLRSISSARLCSKPARAGACAMSVRPLSAWAAVLSVWARFMPPPLSWFRGDCSLAGDTLMRLSLTIRPCPCWPTTKLMETSPNVESDGYDVSLNLSQRRSTSHATCRNPAAGMALRETARVLKANRAQLQTSLTTWRSPNQPARHWTGQRCLSHRQLFPSSPMPKRRRRHRVIWH